MRKKQANDNRSEELKGIRDKMIGLEQRQGDSIYV